MSGAPRRLRDDPDFAWETGCDLADEAFAVGGYDLPQMKGKVLAAVQPPSVGAPLKAASRGVAPWVGGSVLVGVVLLGGLLWAWAPVAPAVVDTTPAAAPELDAAFVPGPAYEPVPEPEPELELELEPEAAAVPAPSQPEPEPEVEATPVQASASDEPVAVPVEAAGAPDGPAVADAVEDTPPPVAPPAASGLQEELAAYDAAAALLADGQTRAAASGFEAYLAAFPGGRLLDEAELGLLRALVELGDHGGVEEVAARLQERPSMAPRQAEILRTRAENLVHLERCDEAVALIASLPARDRGDVRRACRR